MDDDTVRGHSKAYMGGSTDALLSDGRGGRAAKLDAPQLALLDAHLSQKVYATTAGIIEWVPGNFGVRYSRTGMAELLERMGYVYKKPKRMPPCGDPKKQREFEVRYRELEKRPWPR